MFTGYNGFRGFIALLVVIYHLNQYLPWGLLTSEIYDIHRFIMHFCVIVSIFFVLSAMFRSLSYWKKIDKNEKIPEFLPSLKDRFLRIAPVYYIILIVSFIMMWLLWWPEFLNFQAIIYWFLFISWISAETLFPVFLNGPLWFASFDMIWWIMTSYIMMGFAKIRKIFWIPYIIVIIAGLFGLHYIWMNIDWNHGFTDFRALWFPAYNPFLFGLHFVAWIGAGYILHIFSKKFLKNIAFDIIFSIGFCGIIYFLWFFHLQSDFLSHFLWPYFFPFFPISIAFLLAILPFTKYISHAFDNKFFLFLGKISYSLYLTHILVLLPLKLFAFNNDFHSFSEFFIFAWLWIILSIFVAYGVHRFIEMRFIPKK